MLGARMTLRQGGAWSFLVWLPSHALQGLPTSGTRCREGQCRSTSRLPGRRPSLRVLIAVTVAGN